MRQGWDGHISVWAGAAAATPAEERPPYPLLQPWTRLTGRLKFDQIPLALNRSALACAVLERLSYFLSAHRVQLQEAEGSSRFWWLRFWAMRNASAHRRVRS